VKDLNDVRMAGKLIELRGTPMQQDMGPEWPEPIPVMGKHTTAPLFPLHALPAWLRRWVEAEAEATQTPVDLAAMVAFGVIALCVSFRRLRIHIYDTWHEWLNIFVCIIMFTGERKSVVFGDGAAPVEAFIDKLKQAMRPAARRSQIAITLAQKRLDKAIQDASKVPLEDAPDAPFSQREVNRKDKMGRDTDVEQAQQALEAAEAAQVHEPQLVCSDATQEAIAALLGKQGQRIGLLDAEGGGPFQIMLGRYGQGGNANLDIYLRTYSGDSFSVERVGKPRIDLPSALITICLTIQPEVLDELSQRKELRGKGLLARFWWSFPTSRVGYRKSRGVPMPAAVRDEYNSQITKLLELAPPPDGKAHTIEMGDEGGRLLDELHEATEEQLRPDGDLGRVADWVNRYRAHVARMAGLLHCAEHADDPCAVPVATETVERACEIGRYMLPHAEAVLEQIQQPSAAEVACILKWLREHYGEQERSGSGDRYISRAALHRALRGRFKKAADMDTPLDRLAEYGWIRRVKKTSKVGAAERTIESIELNPAMGVSEAES
jgi:hypothetical protein